MRSKDESDWLERAIEAADPWASPPSSRLDNYDPARAGQPWNWKPEGKARFTRAMLKAAILILTLAVLLVSV